jgi:hypothetical protein
MEMQETHEIHTSEIRSFLACRRRWDWAYREGYVLERHPQPLEFGIAFHIALECFFDPKTWKSTTPKQKIKQAQDAFIIECERQRINYLRETNQERLLEGDGDNYTERIELGLKMIEWYGTQIHPEWDQWFRPIMVEVPFRVPLFIPGIDGEPLTCRGFNCGQNHPVGAPVTYDGRIDMIIEDIHNGGYFIWDHKSAATVRKDDRYLQIDPQVGGYTWAAKVMLGLDVRGFMYVEYRKGIPEMPKVLKRRRGGGIFSQDKNAMTNLDLFLSTVREHDKKAWEDGVYDEYIEFLRSKDAPLFHNRFPIIKTKKELANMGSVISDIAADMVSPQLRVYPTPGQFSCSGCGYFVPCQSKFLGEDYTHSLSTSFKKVK